MAGLHDELMCFGDTKRQRTGGSGSTSEVRGDDANDIGYDALRRWQLIVSSHDAADPGGVARWEDEDFPATELSIDGKTAPKAAAAADPPPPPPPRPAVPGATPQCRCGTGASKTTVTSQTPNKGRQYFVCKTRSCGFFAWVDGGASSSSSSQSRGPKKPLHWVRFPQLGLVSDFGFRAEDLSQGGLGDCWFLSALAVVAQRHDLCARLFADTAANAAGCYSLRFFLDGEWKSVLVDDRLPTTEDPRRPELAAANLAYTRCVDSGGGSGAMMLWASLIEKAYAKVHGCYKAISGGEISEALLDLTGAPTLSVSFDEADFDSELLWHSMREWVSEGLPMGCATSSENPELKEVGLVGQHAYSILNVREVQLRQQQPHFGGSATGFGYGVASSSAAGLSTESERLVRIRNPHGVGEWKGEWSDRSARWSELIGQQHVSEQRCV